MNRFEKAVKADLDYLQVRRTLTKSDVKEDQAVGHIGLLVYSLGMFFGSNSADSAFTALGRFGETLVRDFRDYLPSPELFKRRQLRLRAREIAYDNEDYSPSLKTLKANYRKAKEELFAQATTIDSETEATEV